MLDRKKFEARLAQNAVRPKLHKVTLPNAGEKIWLRPPNREMIQRAFVGAGDDADQSIVGMINLLRFMLVDADYQSIPRSFDEARSWFLTIDDEDSAVVLEAVSDLIDGLMGDAAADPEAGGDPKES